jgi:Xaa-Pro aminopeptidase
MRYQKIDPRLFIENRDRLRALLPPKSLAVFNSNDILPTNADGTMRLRQNSDIFYHSGIHQEETILVIFPDAPDEKQREMLFTKETSEVLAIWEGSKHTKQSATETSGIDNIHWLDAFPGILRMLMTQAEQVFLNTNEHARATDRVETRDLRFIRELQRNYPLHDFRRLAPLMTELRAIKSDLEIELISKACAITEAGFRRVLGFIKPGVKEFEIEAELIHEYLRQGSDGFAYDPIIGSGVNACVLHYLENDGICEDGEMLLMDVAARYANYNSDLTRTVPVNGRFSERQRAVYHAVLHTMQACSEMLRPGVILKDYQEEAGKLIESELLGLELITKKDIEDQDPDKPAYKKYFMHGTSHHLGLDVHDLGDTWQPVEEGMVFTIEPGIYIPEENFGCRLENNYLIGKDGNIDLMATIPVEPEEIEDLMNAG